MSMKPVLRLLENIMIAMMGVLVFLLFGNVVLRYGFNAGISIYEELSRFLFVWMTFLGATVVMYEGGHLGMNSVVNLLPVRGKKLARILVDLMMLFCCFLLIKGGIEQAIVNYGTLAPITGIPVAMMYVPAILAGVMIAIWLLDSLWRVATGRMAEGELVAVTDEEKLG